MIQSLTHLRYYFELISLPIFVALVVHLAGHGSTLLFTFAHDSDGLLTTENAAGIALTLVFIWLWHRPQLHRWIPCAHEHCHRATSYLHALAIGALCLHFFPEATLRAQLLREFDWQQLTSLATLIGFASHFVVDVIIALLLSLQWRNNAARALSLSAIIITWFAALWLSDYSTNLLTPHSEAVALLISAFLLAMFIHKPHKPQPCLGCH